MLKAIIFDVDGTVLDTREFIFQAYEHVFEAYNLAHLSRKSLADILGKSLEDCYQLLAPHLDFKELCEAHRAFQVSNLALVTPFPNTLETLTTLRRQGLKTAVVTTRRRTGLSSLEQVGIVGQFDYIVTGDDVTHAKPHPEGLLKALRYIQAESLESLMVGDTEVDVQAGKNAGTKTAAALYGLGTKESLEAQQPDYFLKDIAEIVAIANPAI